ncbi:MAG: pyruvate flavodoxin/ferredoxin oxidoreductase [Deltaproteobacteria bacterium]|nr:pyruvate flavodoxin/ferredoxin oxidoreductase [Deltaproteobacteria bacterium]MBW2070488.1 pyruvate flavodoxin/ferredoxin oxidoreductase [Deltaproteobacteria bacterium]
MAVLFVDGNQAVAMAALYAGCRFFASYPITPASTLLAAMLELLPPAGGIVIQGEDEIASIGYCLGASMAGLKVMTATSGPGISLYSENISFAIAGEIPIVIVDVMRQGPSTGSATKGADGDVQFLRWGCSGGLPVIVLAPADVRDCYHLTVHAFNLAEKFRCPVFIASNKEVGMTRETLDRDALEELPVVERRLHSSGTFLPFASRPGQDVPDFLPIGASIPVRQTSSSHGADGYITTDPEEIQRAVERLQRKIEAQQDSFCFYELHQEAEARTLLITYGVTSRAAGAARIRLRHQGVPVSHLTVKTLWPVPAEVLRCAAAGVQRVLVVEMNLGQYVLEVRRVLGKQRVDFLGKMSGKLISPEEIVREVLDGESAQSP